MSLDIFISARAEEDLTQQYRWYMDDGHVGTIMPLRVHRTSRSRVYVECATRVYGDPRQAGPSIGP